MVDFIYVSIAVCYAFLTGFVIKQRLPSAAHRYFMLFLIGLLLWHVTLYLYLFIPLGDWLLFIGRLNYATGPIFSLGLLGFFYTFPTTTFHVSKKTEIFFWGWTIITTLITALTPWVDKNEVYVEGIGPVVELGEGYYLYLLHVFLLPVLTLIIGAKKYRSLNGLAKKKFQYSFWIFVPTMIAFLTSNLILPIFEIIWQFIYSPIFLFPIALSCAFSMYHYRFFDLSFHALKILRQTMILISFSIVGVLCFDIFRDRIFLERDIISFLAAAMVSIFTYQKIQKVLPEFVSSNFRELRYKIDELKSSLYYCNNYHELLKKLESTFVLDLHFTSVQLYLIREKKNNIEIPIYYTDRFTKLIEKEKMKVLVTEELQFQKKIDYLQKMQELNASICFPLYLENRLIGLFLLGKRPTSDSLSREEIEEILKAKAFIELCFINILLQSDLKEENDYMKQMIREKTKHLRHQNQKIKSLLQQQSDFIAVTAHEFRTPLNVALLQLEDTLESYEHSSQVLDDMKVLEASLEKLKGLTKNLFDVQQYDLKKVKLQLKQTDLVHFIRDIYEEFRDITVKDDLELQLDLRVKHLPAWIDEIKMRQVLHNLLSNAQKFVEKKGKIIIRLEQTRHEMEISMIDNGPGIPEESKINIFKKFQTTNAHMGMGIGLGLYLCKTIVDLHKGDLKVSDTPGGGATFTIVLPKTAVRQFIRTAKSPSRLARK